METAVAVREPDPTAGAVPGAVAGTVAEGVSNAELEASICGLAGRLAAATHAWLVMIAEFDRRAAWEGWGVKSCSHWLAWACSLSTAAAREHVRVARALAGLPLTSAAFAAGSLSYSKVRALTRVAAGRVDAGVDEASLVALAEAETASQLERTVRGFRKVEGVGLDQQRRRRARIYWAEDGMLVVSARLPADEGAVLMAAVVAAQDAGEPADLEERLREDREADRLDIDYRALSLADALVAVAQTALDAGPVDPSGDDRRLVVLHVEANDLTEPPTQPTAQPAAGSTVQPAVESTVQPAAEPAAEPADVPVAAVVEVASDPTAEPVIDPQLEQAGLAGLAGLAGQVVEPAAEVVDPVGAPGDHGDCVERGAHPGGGVRRLEDGPGVGRGTAERLACDAMVAVIVSNTVTGTLNAGRRTRKIGPALRRALRVRDVGCQFPSCTRRTYLEAHHIKHWFHGGATDLNNLVMLCRFHHMKIHEAAFTITIAAVHGDQLTLEFRTPSGQLIAASPRLNPGVSTALDVPNIEPGKIRPKQTGEPFSLADALDVLLT